jgi:hypothetical protein
MALTKETKETKEVPQVFVVHLQPVAPCDHPEGFRRLKLMLKAAIRSYRLRAVSVTTSDGTVTAEGINEKS